jgi:hypothetical protein
MYLHNAAAIAAARVRAGIPLNRSCLTMVLFQLSAPYIGELLYVYVC